MPVFMTIGALTTLSGWALVGAGAAVYATVASVASTVMGAQSANDQRKAAANAAADADARATQLVKQQEAAAVEAEKNAQEAARKRIAQRTQTIFSGESLGTQTAQTKLGAN